jgi:aminomethyltransferase
VSKSALKTHLYEFHKAKSEMVEFAGFEMPLWYKGIIHEHMAVRNDVGIFDITHMGRVLVTGLDAEQFLNYVTANDVASLTPLTAQYSIICNDQGGIKDDFVLSKLEAERFLMVYNAANRAKNYSWLLSQSKNFKVKIEDISDNVAMFAVQGPKVEETLQKLSSEDLSKIGRFKCDWTKLAGADTFISRTGYTGEDGFEVFIWNTPLPKPEKAVNVWNTILSSGQKEGIEPCGLGARDTLRLEAGMCLYGNDIDENITPLEAGLSFVVKLQKNNFIGKQVLQKQKEGGVKKKRVGIKMTEKGIPRPHLEVWKDGKGIGAVTSGTMSPLLKCGIAMAYVQVEYAIEGDIVTVKIRDKQVKGTIVKMPFYQRRAPDKIVLFGKEYDYEEAQKLIHTFKT